ncbi:MAG: HAD-IA family hydrolase [Gammaproteobacteria bacterium]|nr:phosphoglycolate phosphatase [Gammaproteobacteria bacterium]
MSVDAVLFDLDGTLVDSAPDLVGVLNRLLAEERRPPIPYAIARNAVSDGAAGLIRLGFGHDLSADRFEALRQRFLELYAKGVCVNSRLFISLDDIIASTSNNAWGVVTNKPHAFTEPLLARLGLAGACRCVVGGDRLPQRKPHPAPLLLAAEELGVEAERCAYVGDAPRDIEAGRAAGMVTIAAAYGYIRPTEDVEAWGADHVVRRPSELRSVLRALSTGAE